jgi:hypothetical protein
MGGVAAILLSVGFNAKFRDKLLNLGDSNNPLNFDCDGSKCSSIMI